MATGQSDEDDWSPQIYSSQFCQVNTIAIITGVIEMSMEVPQKVKNVTTI